MPKFFKIFLKIISGVLLLLLVVLACMVAPADTDGYTESVYYQKWKQLRNTTNTKPPQHHNTKPLKTGWAKVNFTPTSPTPTAGYGVRQGKVYTSVHDSVFVRALVFDNGNVRAALVAVDLLIVPPTVTELLKKKLAKTAIPFERVYLGATHSHNSVGGWGDTFTGKLFAGKFNPANVERIAEAMAQAIRLAQLDLKPTQIGYGEISDSLHIKNRLVEDGKIDPFVRMLRLQRNDGQTALLCTYAAHSTILSSDNIVLSRDYPGVLVDSLERGEANFAVFMSGAVGSMAPHNEGGKNEWEAVVNEADFLEGDVQQQLPKFSTAATSTLQMLTLPLPLRQPNARIALGWKLRPWVFRWAFGTFDSYVKKLRVGNVLLVGLPCDFSGELMADLTQYARKKGLNLVITSFNGGYAGYITPDKYYQKDSYETLTMNWFGPGSGAYFQEIVRDLIDQTAR